ncbi:Hypothetical predicted protein, partial [Pelobates cultripes]
MAAALSRMHTKGQNGRLYLAEVRKIQDGRCAHLEPLEAFSTALKAGEKRGKVCQPQSGLDK